MPAFGTGFTTHFIRTCSMVFLEISKNKTEKIKIEEKEIIYLKNRLTALNEAVFL
jgi:hypothetical protein